MFRVCGIVFEIYIWERVMELHFNLKGIFCFCIFLMLWQMLFPFVFWGGTGLLVAYLLYLEKIKSLKTQDLIFTGAFIVNLLYVAGLNINERQYDYYNYYTQGMFFVENDFFIKNPVDYIWGAFYHPPLWGLISGIVIKIGNILGLSAVDAYDKARYVNLFAVSGVGIIAWRFFNLFEFKKNIILWGWGGLVWFPIQTIMAGLNNNDPLVYFFMEASIYQGYLWYCDDKDSLKKSFIIAGLLIGAGMTKLSGVMTIVYLGMLGLAKLIQKNNFFDKRLWGQFAIIGLGCLLGFSWGFVLLYFGNAVIPPPQNVDFISLKQFSLMEKMFDFSMINHIFPDVWDGGLEHNVWLSLIKTAVFGEWQWNSVVASYIVYILAIFIALFVVYSFIGVFENKIGQDFGLNLAIIVYTFVVMGLWVMLWNRFPYFCSTEFRYVVSLVIISVLWMMVWVEQKKLSEFVLRILAGLIMLFSLAKTIVVMSTV